MRSPMTTLRENLIEIGATVINRGRDLTFERPNWRCHGQWSK